MERRRHARRAGPRRRRHRPRSAVALLVSVRPRRAAPSSSACSARWRPATRRSVRLGPLDGRRALALLEQLVAAAPGTRLAGQGAARGRQPAVRVRARRRARGRTARSYAQGGAAEIAMAEELPSLPLTILHRLSFLPADVLELLGLASVLGDRVLRPRSRPAHRALRGGAGRAVALSAAGRRARASAAIGSTFRHELVRDALYEDMPPSVRRDLHRQLAARLGRRRARRRNAWPSTCCAGPPPGRRARRRCTRSAGARGVAARAGAVDLYRRAIELVRRPGARAASSWRSSSRRHWCRPALLAEGEAAVPRGARPRPRSGPAASACSCDAADAARPDRRGRARRARDTRGAGERDRAGS